MRSQHCFALLAVLSLTLLTMAWPLAAHADPAALSREQRLKIFEDSVADFQIRLAGAADPLKLHKQPLLRFENPVGGVVDGVVLIWTDRDRPVVAAQVFVVKDDYWIYEFQSIADGPLQLSENGVARWSPKRAGGELKEITEAPAPAATRVARLAQMKDLARQFSVNEDFRSHPNDPKTERYSLRMLPQPLYRYDQNDTPVDGAVFAFVHGTDPEVLLVLETKRDASGERWMASWAPLTCWALQAKRGNDEVWSVPEMFGLSAVNEPYHIWTFRPEKLAGASAPAP